MISSIGSSTAAQYVPRQHAVAPDAAQVTKPAQGEEQSESRSQEAHETATKGRNINVEA